MATDYTINLGLESIAQLCELLGNPQDNFKSIHIAGTNGKGSVGAYIESILMESGYTVGRYTSPAIENILETITVNRVPISAKDYQTYSDKVTSTAKLLKGVREPSLFEIETAIAFEYLSTRCDIALIEVGMGGRLDATNVLHNKALSVITSISLDHTQYLGDTLEKIAFEKCGIIQEGVPTVTIAQNSEVMHTIRSICEDKNSTLNIANAKDVQNVELSTDYTLLFDYLGYTSLNSHMIGDFQTDNAILSIVACETLGIPTNYIATGISKAMWKYRFEIVQRNPLIILDGCHNADASKRLRNSIDTYFKGKSIAYIMGIFKDKDYTSIVHNLCDRASIVYTISTDGKRSLSAKALADVVAQYNSNVIPCDSISQAIALNKQSPCDVTIVLGSLSTLGEIRKNIVGNDD
jgi:dihydrofolate synthase/folylpolyglutamate synthase